MTANNVVRFKATGSEGRIELLFRCTTGLIAITLPVSEARGLITALAQEIAESEERIFDGKRAKADRRRGIDQGERHGASPSSFRRKRG